MGLPDATEARLFYQSAKQRLEDARFLLDGGRTTGAVYLSGYGVECMLKALILSMIPRKQRGDMLKRFRGSRAHNYDWLRARYLDNGGAPFPANVSRAWTLVNTWDTNLRYRAGTIKGSDAKEFLKSVEQIMVWADGRL